MAGELTRFQYIDSIRGWAVLGVILCHIRNMIPGLPPFVFNVLTAGNYGVQLFFVGSALTLFMSFEKRFYSDSRPILFYWIRRFFRIAPMFWVAVIFYQVYKSPADRFFLAEGTQLWEVVCTFLFIHGFHPESINSVVPGGWSIAVEMTFYLFVPLCFSMIKSLKQGILVTFSSLIVSIVLIRVLETVLGTTFIGVGIDEAQIELFFYYIFLRQFPAFTLGFIVYFLIKIESSSRLWNLIKRYSLYIGILLFIFIVVCQDFLFLDYFIITISYVFIIWGLSNNRNIPLNNKFIAFLGKISFSGYLSHFLVLDIIKKSNIFNAYSNLINPNFLLLLVFLAAVFGTMIISFFTYNTIERGGQQLGRKLIKEINMKMQLPAS